MRKLTKKEVRRLLTWANKRINGWQCSTCDGKLCAHCTSCIRARCVGHAPHCPAVLLTEIISSAR